MSQSSGMPLALQSARTRPGCRSRCSPGSSRADVALVGNAVRVAVGRAAGGDGRSRPGRRWRCSQARTRPGCRSRCSPGWSPCVMSHSSGTPLVLQSWRVAGRDVAVVRNAVAVAVELALVRDPVGVAVRARSRRDVALVGNTVGVAVRAASPVVMSQSSGTPLALQSTRTHRGCRWCCSRRSSRCVMSHSSGTPFGVAVGRPPVVMSQSSGTPLALQSISHSSGIRCLQSTLVPVRDVALVRNAVGVAVRARRRW